MGLDSSAYARKGEPTRVKYDEYTYSDEAGNEVTEDEYEWEWEDEINIGEWRNDYWLEAWMMEVAWVAGRQVNEADKKHYENGVLVLQKNDLLKMKQAIEKGDEFFDDLDDEHREYNPVSYTHLTLPTKA